MKKETRVKITNMTYNKDNHLFQLYVIDLGDNKEAIFAVKGTDWGIPPGTPDDLIKQFCEDMTGKEKNLFIEMDKTSTETAEKDSEGNIPLGEMNKLYEHLYNYPINEMINTVFSEGRENEN